MSDISSGRLIDLWTRHLAGELLTSEELATLIDAFAEDEVFRRRVLLDHSLDGALRAEADLQRNEPRMLETMRELLFAAARSDGFVERLRPRLQRAAADRAWGSEQAERRRAWGRRGIFAGLALTAGLAAAFVVGVRPAPRRAGSPPGRQTLSHGSPPAAPTPQVAASTARAGAASERAARPKEERHAILLTGADDPTELEGPSDQAGGDDRLRARLEQLGFDVQVMSADDVDLSDVRHARLVVLSSSVATPALSNELIGLPVPMIALESSAFDRMGLTGPVWQHDLGITPSLLADVVVTDPAHPLAGGLSGQVAVLSRRQRLRWGVPGLDAISIASYPGAPPNRSLFFAYDRGASTPGGPAPARRVALFLGNARIVRRLTPQGWRMFDAAVSWSVDDTSMQ